MLNYGYPVLYSQIRTQIVADGLDPGIGLMHRHATLERDNLVLDLMEPLRPVVDHTVFEMVRDEAFSSADFNITPGGVCRLNPQMARRLAQNVSNAAFPDL